MNHSSWIDQNNWLCTTIFVKSFTVIRSIKTIEITSLLDCAFRGVKLWKKNKHKLKLLGCKRENRACLKHVSFRGKSNWLRAVFSVDFSIWTCSQLPIAFNFVRAQIDWDGRKKFSDLCSKTATSISLFAPKKPTMIKKKILKTIASKLTRKWGMENLNIFFVPTLRHFIVNLQHIKLWKKKSSCKTYQVLCKEPPRVKVGILNFLCSAKPLSETLCAVLLKRKWKVETQWHFNELEKFQLLNEMLARNWVI